MDECEGALAGNYAIGTTDMGPSGRVTDGGFAYDNMQGKIDFAYRATHVAAVAAKEIVKAFYERPATRSYFSGCSTGGRQALMEAQRYPEDFDGIIAGPAPIYNAGMMATHSFWGRKQIAIPTIRSFSGTTSSSSSAKPSIRPVMALMASWTALSMIRAAAISIPKRYFVRAMSMVLTA